MLAAAAALVPLEQARIHTLTSLVKHVDFGAWFAAIVVGYAVDRAIGGLRPAGLRAAGTGACVLLLLIPARLGSAQSLQLAQDWPNAARFDAALSRPVGHHPGRTLVETPSLAEYYLGPLGTHWKLWSSTRSIVLPSGHSISGVVGAAGNPAVYARYIRAGYFRWVALDFLATRPLDQDITADLARNPAYRVAARVPYGTGSYIIWEYAPPPGNWPGALRRTGGPGVITAGITTGPAGPWSRCTRCLDDRAHSARAAPPARARTACLPQRCRKALLRLPVTALPGHCAGHQPHLHRAGPGPF